MPTPQLQHMTVADLTDTDRLLVLYAQSVRAKLIGPSEAERLTFVGLAQHVLAHHPKNAGGLFRQLLVRRCFHYVRQEEEDVAQRRLKQYLFTGGGSPMLQTLDTKNWSGSQTMAA
jgi:hypothetical protein